MVGLWVVGMGLKGYVLIVKIQTSKIKGNLSGSKPVWFSVVSRAIYPALGDSPFVLRGLL